MKRVLTMLICVAVLQGTAFAASWTAMDYRPPGLTYCNTNWPDTNTDYSLICRAARQVRGEAFYFATAEHNSNGTHKTGFFQPWMLSNGFLSITGGLWNPMDLYSPAPASTNTATNITYNWSGTTVMSRVVGGDATAFTATSGGLTALGVAGGDHFSRIADAGSGYSDGDIVTVVGGTGDAQTQFQLSCDAERVITAVTTYSPGGYSEQPSDPVSVTGGSGNGLQLTLYDQWGNWMWRGPWTNLPVGSVFRVSKNATTWTGVVSSVETNGLALTSTEASPWTSTEGISFTAADSVLTNVVQYSTWTNYAAPTVPDLTPGQEILETKEWTILLGTNGLKLWIKAVKFWSGYGYFDSQVHFPAAELRNAFVPPFSNVHAVVVQPFNGSLSINGAGTNSQSLMLFPTVATAAGWPAAFNVRQYFAQAGTIAINNMGSCVMTSGVICIAVGRDAP